MAERLDGMAERPEVPFKGGPNQSTQIEIEQKLKDPEAEKKDRESRWSPEHREFDHLIERLVARVAGMQLRPEETRKFNVDLEALKKVSGHPQD